LNVGGEEVGILSGFNKTDKPAVHIPAVYASGSGFPVKASVLRGKKADGILYCIYIFGGKTKVIVI